MTDDPTTPDDGLAGYGPTTYRPITGSGRPDEPTVAETTRPAEDSVVVAREAIHPTAGSVVGAHDEPTLANAEPTVAGTTPLAEDTMVVGDDEPTLAEPETTVAETTQPAEDTVIVARDEAALADTETTAAEPALAEPALVDQAADETTVAVGTDGPTTTGPTVGDWPFDQFEPPPPGELIWQPDSPPAPTPQAARSPAYYVSLGAAVVLVVGLVALAAVVTVLRPGQEIAGRATGAVPQITASSEVPPPTTATTQTPAGPLAELAAHPLSSSTTRMPDATCALPRFDPADAQQAAFYAAAKVCADAAWRPVLQAAGLEATVTVVTLTAPAQTRTCGELTPTSPATQCDGIVYLTPAYLRDTEQNGRYPGRYLGVFLREYGRALQHTTGLDEVLTKVDTGSAADLDTRVEQQATCLAGVAAGAMSGRGAVDANIVNEIRDRLSRTDAPPDARSWLDKGFQQRTPAACNSWTG